MSNKYFGSSKEEPGDTLLHGEHRGRGLGSTFGFQ